MIVHKFGGTSLGNAERIASVAGIIGASRQATPTVVVVSAISGTTDRLIAAARAATTNDDVSCERALNWLSETHYGVVDSLLAASPECDELRSLIDEQLGRLGRFLESISVLGELTARGHDAVACFGEQLSAAIVAAAAAQRGWTAVVRRDGRSGDGVSPSHYVVLSRARDELGPLLEDDRWVPARVVAGTRPWTDRYTDIVSQIRW